MEKTSGTRVVIHRISTAKLQKRGIKTARHLRAGPTGGSARWFFQLCVFHSTRLQSERADSTCPFLTGGSRRLLRILIEIPSCNQQRCLRVASRPRGGLNCPERRRWYLVFLHLFHRRTHKAWIPSIHSGSAKARILLRNFRDTRHPRGRSMSHRRCRHRRMWVPHGE
jgi:hypothetical protein